MTNIPGGCIVLCKFKPIRKIFPLFRMSSIFFARNRLQINKPRFWRAQKKIWVKKNET